MIPATDRIRRIRFLAGCFLLFVGILVSPRPTLGQSGLDLDVERTVNKVTIEGNVFYKDGKLRDLLRTRQHSWFKFWKKYPLRADFIRADRATLEAFYHRHGFLTARVDSVTIRPIGTSPQSDVIFHLFEGPRSVVDTILVAGNGPLPETRVRKVLLYHAGSPLDLGVLEASRDSITYEYTDRGYIYARVLDSLSVDSTRVAVRYRIEPGVQVRMREVRVEGTQKTRPSYVSREVLLKPGDVMRRSKLILSQQRIYDSGLYTDVQLETGITDTTTNMTDLVVKVREQKMGWIDAGIGYGTVDQLRLTGQWGQRNIFRSSMRFTVTGKLGVRLAPDSVEISKRKIEGGDRRLDVALTHPWPLGVRLQTTLGAYGENRPVIQRTDVSPYKAVGASIVFASSVLRDTRAALSYALDHISQDTLLINTQYKSYTTQRVILSTEKDTRLNIFDPRQGHDAIARFEVAHAAIPGSGTFSKLGVQGTKYIPLESGSVLAFRVQGGFIEPWGSTLSDAGAPLNAVPHELSQIPPNDRFRTGGASSVRGYEENELGTREIPDTTGALVPVIYGGQVLLLANVELRFPLFWILSGATFFDGGNVWQRPEDMKATKIFSFAGGAGYNDMRYSAGFGLRIGTPVGPFRFDYGFKIRSPRTPSEPDLSARRGEFHFSLGQPF